MIRRALMTFLAATVALSMPSPNRAGEDAPAAPDLAFDLADHLAPENVVLYVTLDDLGRAWKRFPETPLGRLFSDPELLAFFEKLGASSSEGAGRQRMSKSGFAPVKLTLPLKPVSDGKMDLPGRISIAVTADAGPGLRNPGLVGAINVGESRETMVEIVNALIAQIGLGNPDVSDGLFLVEDDQLQKLSLDDLELTYFWRGGTLVLGTERAHVSSVLASVGGETENSLSASKAYRELQRRTRAERGGLFLYFCTRRLAADLLDEEGRRQMEALGLGGLCELGLASSTGADGWGLTRIRVGLEDRGPGLLGALRTGDEPLRAPAYFPRRVLLAASGRIEREGLVEMVRRLEGVQTKGASWAVELAQAAGTEAGLYLAPPAFGPIPEMGAVLMLEDPARAERALVRLMRTEEGFRLLKIRGRRFFRRPARDATPSFTAITVTDRALVAGSSIPVVEKMVRRMAEGPEAGLGGTEGFRGALAEVPGGSAAVLFVDTPVVVDWGWGLAREFLPLLLVGQGVTGADFPSGETLTRHLRPAVSWALKDERGLTIESRSSLGGELPTLSFLLGLGLGFGLTTTTADKAPEPPPVVRVKSTPPPLPGQRARRTLTPEQQKQVARRHACHANLAMFRHRLRQYRQTHERRLPPDLAAFFGPGPAAGLQFFCPEDEAAWKAWKSGEPSSRIYGYFGPRIPTRVQRPDRFPLIWDREPYHQGGRMVLFLDGGIRHVPEKAFQALLARARALTEEAYSEK
jgi:hypothetical protein